MGVVEYSSDNIDRGASSCCARVDSCAPPSGVVGNGVSSPSAPPLQQASPLARDNLRCSHSPISDGSSSRGSPTLGMKRMSESVQSNESSPSTKRSRSSGDAEVRLLIQAKTAGSIIGKGGSNISRLRSEYTATITIPDCPGPERVLTIRGEESVVLKVLEEVLNALAEAIPRTGESDVRLLVHQSQAGAIIGKGGEKIKELREMCGGQVKAFSSCCPQSTDRVIQIAGDRGRVLLTLNTVVDTLRETPVKGIENPYNPYNYEDFFAAEYGGWGEGKGRFPRGGGPGMPPMGAPPQGPMGGRGPMGPPQGAMVPRDGGMGPFGDRRRGGGPPGGPFSPPRNGNGMNRRVGGGEDFDMMPSNGVGGVKGGGGGGYWNNNQPMGMAEQITTQVTIPKDVAGAIIGKGGARIRKIRADSCCSINIEDARPGSNDRVITIVGEDQQIKYAQYLLQQSVREFGGQGGRRENY
ncbi:heterogeneous nuclear ribonucleoprotein K homolog isoform X2 [Hyalella azteca]|uniref:Heterogeneous nuclear ribonucleoprotein K homolog isoform X2 n=1 Tax=Hyalella azteca TaxID=294128 RepID=A0A8B7P4P7_HYAAZ|nr:heterogeneous nuclear ribonucleoprotein K homolog isoform X2 [Hyalella azteca]